MTLLQLLLLLLVISLVAGGLGHNAWGVYGWSPAGLIVVVLIVLLLAGRL